MEAAEPTAPLDEVFPEGALGLCAEQGPVLPAEVVTHALTRVLLPKPKQGQVQVEVGHRCLGLGVLQAQSSDLPSVVASTQLAWCLLGKAQVLISPQWIPGSCTCV